MTYLPYPYRTRPAERRWSDAEAAWTRREQGLPMEKPELAPPTRRMWRAEAIVARSKARRQARRSLHIAAAARERATLAAIEAARHPHEIEAAA